MMKLLFWLVILVLAGWWWNARRGARRPAGAENRTDAAPVRRMVACARCGLHLPEDDALPCGGRHYCGPAHRDEDAGGA